MINNAVLVSGVQQSDSLIHIHVSTLFQIPFPNRLLQNIEESSLCYTVGPCWLSILYIAGGWEGAGIDWEFRMDMYTLPGNC